MSLFCSLLFALSSTQFAPPDVPKDHWAYPAVNELFGAGLLDGYPKVMALGLDPTIAFDQKTLDDDMDRWKQQGLLVGYPDGLGRGIPQQRSRYEFAVAVHAVCATIEDLGQKSHGSAESRSQFSMMVVPEIPSLVKAMSMVAPELKKLGADTHSMVMTLNRFWPKSTVAFQG